MPRNTGSGADANQTSCKLFTPAAPVKKNRMMKGVHIMKRIVALILAALMLMGSCALAEGEWTCENCGAEGNTGNFCPACGASRPVTLEPEVEEEGLWTCDNCGSTGNTGNFCPQCGATKPDPYAMQEVVIVTEEAPEVKPAAAAVDFQPGDYVLFGSYNQTDANSGKTSPISWLVLDVKDGKLFLLSQYGLEKLPFNNRSDGTTWEGSTLRKWLNGTFLNTAFSIAEQDAIVTTSVEDTTEHTNSKWNTANRCGGTTQDKVFLLSYKEMTEIVSESDRYCEPSSHVVAQRVYTERHDGKKTCWYWLRTSAFRNNAGVVAADGTIDTCYIHHAYGVVRPALWVDASAVKAK